MNLLRLLLLPLFFVVLLAAPAAAHTVSIAHGGSYWGKDVIVEPDQVIDGNVTVFGGDAVIEGRVNGDVTDFGGSIDTRPGGIITGTTNEYGGDYLSAFAPLAGSRALMAENYRMLERLSFSVIIVLMFLIFPVRVRIALERLERHPGLSSAVGTLTIVAIIPLAILLLISIVLIPLIPVEVIAVMAAAFIGQAALGILVGRRLYELIRPHATPSPLGALVLGLVVISAAEIVPAVGGLITMLVIVVGLGAAVLAFIRDGALGTARVPIAGPPMNPA
ncbi:MAG: hypothetical protein DLM50_08775 [Candidatus Meridianibacter frigidus]|nr:MAG: hypothetical protein DLM50_08775 [Candidatus Eremiobacteraeota bacterium]